MGSGSRSWYDLSDEQKAAVAFTAIGVSLIGGGVAYLTGIGGFMIYLGFLSIAAALIVVGPKR